MHIAAATEINSRFVPSLQQLHKSLDSKVFFFVSCFPTLKSILVLCLLYLWVRVSPIGLIPICSNLLKLPLLLTVHLNLFLRYSNQVHHKLILYLFFSLCYIGSHYLGTCLWLLDRQLQPNNAWISHHPISY
jgi:hypothetical protein